MRTKKPQSLLLKQTTINGFLFKCISILFTFSIFLITSCSRAKEFLLGGSEDSWKVPLPSVLSVDVGPRIPDSGSAILSIRVSAASEREGLCKLQYVGTNRRIQRRRYQSGARPAGPFYFLSGTEGHCQKGLKLAMVVMSNRHEEIRSHIPAPAPAPTPSASAAPPKNIGVVCSFGGGFMGIVIGLGISLAMMVLV